MTVVLIRDSSIKCVLISRKALLDTIHTFPMSLNGETEIVLEEVSRNRSCSNEVVEVVDDIKHSFTKLSLRDSFSESLPARCFDWDEASIGSR